MSSPTAPPDAPSGPVLEAAGSTSARPILRKSWVIALVIIALVITAVALAGGFKQRSLITRQEAGEPVDMGPLTIIPERAEYSEAFYGGDDYTVDVYGTCQATASDSFDVGLAVSDSVQLVQPTFSENPTLSVSWQGGNDRNLIPPGMPPYDCSMQFRVKDLDTSSPTAKVGFMPLVWGDPYSVKFGVEMWYTLNYGGTLVTMPLVHKPE